jgi:photosystem II stability/assembly factor-like uncharacterized protein
MRKCIFVLSFLYCSALIGQNRWDNVDNILGIPQGIVFADSNICFTLTTQGLTNRLFKSSNQGEDWEMIWGVNDNARIYSANSLAAVDSNTIYMGFSNGVLLRSHDGGREFAEVQLESVSYYNEVNMYNKDIGVIQNWGATMLTRDAWNSFEVLPKDSLLRMYTLPRFLNDSILYAIGITADGPPSLWYCHKMNINTLESETHLIDIIDIIQDFHIVNENLMFVCGESWNLPGGSGNDIIYRTTDAGHTWENVLEIRPTDSKLLGITPFGLQSIAFKDSLTGIAVGQFGKIIYTYDGGNSWHYEANLHESIVKNTPPTMIVRYAGTQPIIATFTRHIYKLRDDNLAPNPNDNLSISGRVWDGERGQARIPIALNDYHITMTDKEGYYKFTNLAKGSYTVKALNKYYDGANESYYYKPYEYVPERYSFELYSDTTEIDFNAEFNQVKYFVEVLVSYIDERKTAEVVRINENINPISMTNYGHKFFIEPGLCRINILNNNYVFEPEFIDLDVVGDTTVYFVGRSATDVKELGKTEQITHYISGDKLYINSVLNTHNFTIKIYDLLGNIALSTEYKQEIDISKFPSGIYFLNVFENELIIKQEKFMIIR